MSEKIYWVRRDGNLGRHITYGDEVKNLDPMTLRSLKAKGYISDVKPDSVSAAATGSISALGQANAELIEQVAELKAEIESLEAKNEGLIKELNDPQVKAKKTKEKIKGLEDKIKELETADGDDLEEKVTDLESKLEEANGKIVQLEVDLENATTPEG